jgi:hypothetical protein
MKRLQSTSPAQQPWQGTNTSRHWRWTLIPQEHSLRQLFHEVVSECYDSRLGLRDAEISSYVADLLTEFCRAENIYRIRDAAGNPLREVGEMLLASDPVHGTASSFGEERERRKHIGDYALFFTGMYPDSMQRWGQQDRDNFYHMVQAGKESYYIVSQFDLFEYKQEAPFFGRLAGSFESCIYGLNMVRGELDRRKAIAAPHSTQIM